MSSVLTVTSVGSLLLSWKALEQAHQADVRSAINRVLNCAQIAVQREELAPFGFNLPVEKLCEGVEIERLRQFIKESHE